MHLRFDKSTTDEFAAVTGLPSLTGEQEMRVKSDLKKVIGIVDAKFEGQTLLLKPDVHVLFEETIARVADRLDELLPNEDIVFTHKDKLQAVRAFNSCWPARVES